MDAVKTALATYWPDLALYAGLGVPTAMVVWLLAAAIRNSSLAAARRQVTKFLDDWIAVVPLPWQKVTVEVVGYFGGFLIIVALAALLADFGATPLAGAYRVAPLGSHELTASYANHRADWKRFEGVYCDVADIETRFPGWWVEKRRLGKLPSRAYRGLCLLAVLATAAGAIDAARRAHRGRGMLLCIVGLLASLLFFERWAGNMGGYLRAFLVAYNEKSDGLPTHGVPPEIQRHLDSVRQPAKRRPGRTGFATAEVRKVIQRGLKTGSIEARVTGHPEANKGCFEPKSPWRIDPSTVKAVPDDGTDTVVDVTSTETSICLSVKGNLAGVDRPVVARYHAVYDAWKLEGKAEDRACSKPPEGWDIDPGSVTVAGPDVRPPGAGTARLWPHPATDQACVSVRLTEPEAAGFVQSYAEYELVRSATQD